MTPVAAETSDAARSREYRVPVGDDVLAGTLCVPPSPGDARPAALLLGGTFSDLRDGDPDPRVRPGVPPHRMYAKLAAALADRGIASFRFDRRGCGRSTGDRDAGRDREIADAAAVWDWLQEQPGIGGPLAMVGESAGAYVLCRLAAGGRQPAAAVLQGALHRSIVDLLRDNLVRAERYMGSGAEAADWVRHHAPQVHADVRLWPEIERALMEGRATARGSVDGATITRDLGGLDYDLANPPADQLAHLDCPALVIHGADDLNVLVDDAFATVRSLWDAGRRDVELQVLAGADHSFQVPAPDPETRIRERLTLASFARPFHPRYPAAVVEYLERQLCTDHHDQEDGSS